MGVSKSADFDDFMDDETEGDEFEHLEDAAERVRPPAVRRNGKTDWRSVEDYLENRRLKRQLSDVFDDEWKS